MENFNIYLSGVGGQGIGMLSETILRAADHAGLNVKSVDTHGLAQRGGIVVSQIRLGEKIYTPLIPEGAADLAVSLERHEALRAVNLALKDGGVLIYYNAVWQPLDVRLGSRKPVTEDQIRKECKKRNVQVLKVMDPELTDSRMQNTVVLSNIVHHDLIPRITRDHYQTAMSDLMAGKKLEDNMRLFNRRLG